MLHHVESACLSETVTELLKLQSRFYKTFRSEQKKSAFAFTRHVISHVLIHFYADIRRKTIRVISHAEIGGKIAITSDKNTDISVQARGEKLHRAFHERASGTIDTARNTAKIIFTENPTLFISVIAHFPPVKRKRINERGSILAR